MPVRGAPTTNHGSTMRSSSTAGIRRDERVEGEPLVDEAAEEPMGDPPAEHG